MNSAGKNKTIDLENIPLFQGLSCKERNIIKQCSREETFKKGEILFSEGMACERIFIVQSGRIKLFRHSSAGREQILEVLGPGDTCACNPGQTHWPCSSSAQAITICEVWFFSRFNYVRMIQNNSKITHALNRIFAERLCRFSSLIEKVSLDDPRKRLIKFILDMANQQECQCEKNNCVCATMTQEEMSQRLGLVRVTVARHLHQLQELKLISCQAHQITILDKDGLSKALL